MYHVRTVWIADDGNNEDFTSFDEACRYAAHLHFRNVHCVIRQTEDGRNPRNGIIVKTGRACAAEYPGEAPGVIQLRAVEG